MMYFPSTWAVSGVSIYSSANHGTISMLEPAQIRAARALLGWRQEDLSKASGVGTATIQRIEKTDSQISGYVSTLLRIQAAFENARGAFHRR